jgi:hypothetical protein
MRRRLLVVFAVVLIALGVWFWMSTARIIRSERDLTAKLNAIITYYVEMKASYTHPLLNLSEVTSQDRAALTRINDELSALEQTNGVEAGYQQLRVVLRSINRVLSSGELSEKVTIDSHYQEWNINATNRGRASELILEYNRALNMYNMQMQSVLGTFLKQWIKWPFTEYLSINGDTMESTTVSF